MGGFDGRSLFSSEVDGLDGVLEDYPPFVFGSKRPYVSWNEALYLVSTEPENEVAHR